MKRQPARHLVSLRLTEEQIAWLRDETDRQDRSIGWIVRDIVEQARRAGKRRREKTSASADQGA